MADLGELERSARRYRIAGGPRTGKSSIEELLFGRLWLPANHATTIIVVVDAVRGLDADARAALLEALRIDASRVVVAVNRMDLAGYEYETFKTVRGQIDFAVAHAGHAAVAVVPVSARFGDNILRTGDRIDWYAGATLVELLQAAAARRMASLAAEALHG
jgi:sulfate adenylyltransferase subunit 1 (EFTu-like GTPase family)